MKKIVGILGMAAVLASAVFAAEPAANFVMSEFTGSADFGWAADFANKDGVNMGMYNSNTASLKFGFVTAGDKVTTGDGIWGELKISSKASDAAAMPAAPSVDTAKIHFVDGDFAAALNILKPSLKYSAYAPMMATPAGIAGDAIDANADENLKAGFGLEVAMDKIFAASFKFMDDGVYAPDGESFNKVLAKDKKYGLAIDASLKAVPNLTADVAFATNFDTKYMGIQAKAGYDFALDMLADGFYLAPGVAFTYAKENADAEAKNSLAAGLMFGMGAKDCDPDLDFIDPTAKKKTNEGISVAVSTNMKDKGLKLGVGAYYESLFSKLGLDDFGQLKLGAEYVFAQAAADTLKAAAKYHLDFSPLYFNVHGGMQLTMPETGDTTTEYKVGVGVGTKEIIDNTDVFVNYELGGAKEITTNNIKVGTKISF